MNILWQLVIPLVFVLLALVFAVTVGQDGTFGTEPSRAITLSTSALSDNRTFFWAQLNSTPGDLNLNFDVRKNVQCSYCIIMMIHVQ